MGVGQTAALRPQVLPLNAANPSGYWYVDGNDPHVAFVGDTTAVDLNEATVVVRGVAPGDADVIVFSNGYADGDSCTVHVVENYTPAENVTVSTGMGRSLRLGDSYTYDPSANILTVSGGIGSDGRAPAIRSEIDGLTVAFTGEPTLSAAQSVLWLEADTTVTGAATLRSTGSVPVYVTNGASLTLDGADLTVIGPSGIHATGTGESLTVVNAGLSVSGIVEALGGFDGGITLTGSVLLGGLHIENGAVIGATALEIVPAPAYGTPDFTLPAMIRTIENGAFEGIDAGIVCIPDGCTSIGRGAFRSCPSLTQIRVPAGCAIGEEAFDGRGTVFVFAPAGSPAQTFCADPANPNCLFIAE